MFLGSIARHSEERKMKAVPWLKAVLGVTPEGAGSKTPNTDTATLCRGPCGFGALWLAVPSALLVLGQQTSLDDSHLVQRSLRY